MMEGTEYGAHKNMRNACYMLVNLKRTDHLEALVYEAKQHYNGPYKGKMV
jgi:hypothetical protein